MIVAVTGSMAHGSARFGLCHAVLILQSMYLPLSLFCVNSVILVLVLVLFSCYSGAVLSGARDDHVEHRSLQLLTTFFQILLSI